MEKITNTDTKVAPCENVSFVSHPKIFPRDLSLKLSYMYTLSTERVKPFLQQVL